MIVLILKMGTWTSINSPEWFFCVTFYLRILSSIWYQTNSWNEVNWKCFLSYFRFFLTVSGSKDEFRKMSSRSNKYWFLLVISICILLYLYVWHSYEIICRSCLLPISSYHDQSVCFGFTFVSQEYSSNFIATDHIAAVGVQLNVPCWLLMCE